MSENEVPEGVDAETGEVVSEDDLAEIEEAEEGAESPPPASDEPGPEAAEEEATPAPDDSEPAPDPGVEDRRIEENTKTLNKASQAYIKKVVDALGPDLEGMETCPLCAETWPGVRFPVMPTGEYLARVRVAIGLEPGDNLPKDNYSRPCSTCDGWGRVDTGSKVAAQASATCIDCKGRGWVAVGDERASGAVTAGNVPPEVAPFPVVNGGAGEPPEAESLRSLGWIVVAPPKVEAPPV